MMPGAACTGKSSSPATLCAMSTPVTVVGAGVVGLSAAIRLAETRRFDVRIVAADVGPRTLSRIAAAVWYPYAVAHPRIDAWLRESLRAYRALHRKGVPGIEPRDGRELFRSATAESRWKDLLPSYAHGGGATLGASDAYVDRYAFTTFVIEMPKYLPWLEEQARRLGVPIEVRRLATLDEVATQDGVVVNCSGVWARRLVPDPELQPTLGQLIRVEKGSIDLFSLDETPGRPAYVIPRHDDVVLGTIDEPWNADRDGLEPPAPTPERDRAIRERCALLDARTVDAPILESYCGLRPARREVRLEFDLERAERGERVVHDYGHGGAGVTLSWGCAHDVVAMVTAVA